MSRLIVTRSAQDLPLTEGQELLRRQIVLEEPMPDELYYPLYLERSSVRGNIIQFYPFPQGASVLEIGAGVGAVTGTLAGGCASLTALEHNVNAARVVEARVRAGNTAVVAGDLDALYDLGDKFDAIFIGDLSAAAREFTGGDVDRFAERVTPLLHFGGRVIAAFDNRFSLSRMLGSALPEGPFQSLRRGAEPGRYLDKLTVVEAFRRCQLGLLSCYYPAPDKDFTQRIFSSRQMPPDERSGDDNFYYLSGSAVVRLENDLLDDVAKGGGYDFLAGSYLLEFGDKGAKPCPVTFVQYTSARKREHRVITAVFEDGVVQKTGLTPAAADHFREVMRYEEQIAARGIEVLRSNRVGGSLVTPFVQDPTVDVVLCRLARQNKKAQFLSLVKSFYELILQSSDIGTDDLSLEVDHPELGAREVSVGPVLREGYYDLCFHNCFYRSRRFIVFDQEWCEPSLPALYILYRSIRKLYDKKAWLEAFYPAHELMAVFKIHPHAMQYFEALQRDFAREIQDEYFGGFFERYAYTEDLDIQNRLSPAGFVEQRIAETKRDLSAERARAAELLSDLAAAAEERGALQKRLDEIERSLAFKITKPFRR